MQLFQQSETTADRRKTLVYLVDDTDGKTAETGVTLSAGDVKIGKNGTEENYAGTWTEVAGGRYTYEFTSGELDTIGIVTFALVKSGIRTFIKEGQVVSFDPYDAQSLGLGAFDDIMNKTNGGSTFDQTTDSLEALRDALATKAEVATEVWGSATRLTMKKGVASYFDFRLVDATDKETAETGMTGISAQIAKDGASPFVSCTNVGTIAEIGLGFYKISLTSTEMNADRIILVFTKTGCYCPPYQIFTQATS